MSLTTFKEQIWPVKDKLYRFALRLVSNVAEAEDVVQEVLMRLWRSRDDWERIQNLEAWSMTLTKNLALDRLRARHRKNEPLDGEIYHIADHDTDPGEAAEYEDTLHTIKKLMASLPENQRMVMHLRDMEGYTYQEICEILAMPMTQVKTNLFRARQKVKEALLKTESYGLRTDRCID